MIILVIAIFLGLNNPELNLGSTGWGIMIGWTAWAVIIVSIIEIVEYRFDYNYRLSAEEDFDNLVRVITILFYAK